MKSVNANNFTTNLFWRFLERFGAQIVSFVVSIVLARLLDPEAYGIVALLTVFITLFSIFADSGLGTALVQKNNADQLDFSTVFFANIFCCLFLYIVLFITAPFIADFYNNSSLTPLIRVMGIMIIISSIKNVEHAYVARHMMFKKFFLATLLGTILSAFVGIYLAFTGFGPWALVFQSLTNMIVDTIVLWVIVRWRPTFAFSFNRLKALYSFGWKLLISSLLDTGYKELRQLIIGKRYTSTDLAYYNKGNTLPNMVVTNINSSIDSVLLPTMASAQDNKERVKTMMRRSLKTSVIILAPMLIGLAAIAENLTMLLLGSKWIGSVFYMRIFCIVYIFYPIHTVNLNAIKAMGRSDYFLGLEIAKKIIGLIAIFITMWISVEAMAWSLLVTSVTSQIINSWPNRKLLGYSYLDQIKDIFPGIAVSIAMGVIVMFIGYIPFPHYVIAMLVQIIAGFLFYFVTCKLLKLESFSYVLNMGKNFIKRKIPTQKPIE